MAVRSSRGRHSVQPVPTGRPAQPVPTGRPAQPVPTGRPVHRRDGTPGHRRRAAPLLAFVAVLLVAIGGFWVAGRPTGADRTVGLVTERRDQPAGTETAGPDRTQDDPGSR